MLEETWRQETGGQGERGGQWMSDVTAFYGKPSSQVSAVHVQRDGYEKG